MVSGVQAKVLQQDIRERRSNARGAHSDACALLERPRAPQTAHRIPLVGGGGGGVMTPIARNGIRARGLLAEPGFKVLPRRWVVERSFSWTGQNRRMSKDYERLPETGETLLYVVMSRLMVRRLARS